jgi:hypothetical protein
LFRFKLASFIILVRAMAAFISPSPVIAIHTSLSSQLRGFMSPKISMFLLNFSFCHALYSGKNADKTTTFGLNFERWSLCARTKFENIVEKKNR